MFDKLVQKWLGEGTINDQQAEVILKDLKNEKKSASSAKMVTTISVVGAVLLGLGAIMLVASNWQTMPNMMKVLLMVGSTFLAYFCGYNLKYNKATLPKVGAALLLLGGMLFGASIFVIAQIYHVNANRHTLVLIWIVANLPLVYAFLSQEIACLVAILFFVWVPSFVYQNIAASRAFENIMAFPILFLVSGVLLYGIGGLHYMKDSLSQIARIYRLVALSVILMCLFLLTFNTFSGSYQNTWGTSYSVVSYLEKVTTNFKIWVALAGVAGFVISIVNFGMERSEERLNLLEACASTILISCALLLLFLPSSTNIYMWLFNILYISLVGTVTYYGFEREDVNLTTLGLRCIGIFIIAKYFDFFWQLFSRSMFFIIGGLILVYGGIYLERLRLKAQESFKKGEAAHG